MASYYQLFIDADLNNLDRVAVANARIEVLKKEIKEHNIQYNSGVNVITAYFIHQQRMKAHEEITFLEKHKNKPPNDGKLTSEQIFQARNFPIEYLIEFNESGKAKAWCHEDKNPSLSLWKGKNRARCFVCNETFNPIDVVMQKSGLTFYEAVRSLI